MSSPAEPPDSPSPSAPQPDPKWVGTAVTNLVRYAPSGTYFARIRVKGQLIVKSLKTKVISVAKLRLRDLEKAERTAAELNSKSSEGKLLVGQAAKVLQDRVDTDTSLKPKSRLYYRQRIIALFKSWPGLEKRELREVSERECITWAASFSSQTCATAFNNTVAVLRRIFDIGMEQGVRYGNPANSIKKASVQPKDLQLPNQEQFNHFLRSIETAGSRWSPACSDLVRFLAFGGFRISEAANITWGDVNREKGTIRVSGDPEQGTKSGLIRFVPIIEDMAALLDRLQELQPDRKPTDRVMQVRECQKAMDRAATEVGMTRITHHDLRHLFATRCIESGVDIPTVSRWLGHQDGGALAMKVYGHLRDDHSKAMAKKVSFSAPAGAQTPKPASAAPEAESATPKRGVRKQSKKPPTPSEE